jgi:hypothetical protein
MPNDNDVPNLRRVAPAYRGRDVPTVPTGDDSIDGVQERVRKSIDDMRANSPDLAGAVVGAVLLPGYDNEIEHGLGKTPEGWRAESVFVSPFLGFEISRNDKTLIIRQDGAGICGCTLRIW